jgi:prepilin-type N-terminal cleavage/methylation domain-containing protein
MVLKNKQKLAPTPQRALHSKQIFKCARLVREFNSGFSLIEAMVVIFIIGLLVIAISTFQRDVFSLNTLISNSLTAQDEGRRALKTMTAEIRPLSPSSVGAYPIAEANPTSFIFYSNIDSDQLKERVRYFLDGATLKKGVIKPSGAPLSYNPANEIITELIHDVANGATPIFSYYDTNYDGTTPPLAQPLDILKIRLVEITVVIDKNPNRSPGPITLTTQVSMRNLKDNL